MSNRKSHSFGVVSSQNISKIARWHNKIDKIAVLNNSLLEQLSICIKIIYRLWNKPANVYRVGRRKAVSFGFKFFCILLVSKNHFDASLGIVKIASNSGNMCVFTLLGDHLQLLDGTYTLFRKKHNYFNTIYSGKTFKSRFACISRCCRKYDNILFYVVFLFCHLHESWQN